MLWITGLALLPLPKARQMTFAKIDMVATRHPSYRRVSELPRYAISPTDPSNPESRGRCEPTCQ